MIKILLLIFLTFININFATITEYKVTNGKILGQDGLDKNGYYLYTDQIGKTHVVEFKAQATTQKPPSTTSTTTSATTTSSIITTISSTKDSDAKVVSNTMTNDGKGNFAFSFETSNHIMVDNKGNLKKIVSPDGVERLGGVQEGSYSYIGKDGRTYEVDWIADEHGFQPQPNFSPTIVPPIDIRFSKE